MSDVAIKLEGLAAKVNDLFKKDERIQWIRVEISQEDSPRRYGGLPYSLFM